jgi:hypothetical protein
MLKTHQIQQCPSFNSAKYKTKITPSPGLLAKKKKKQQHKNSTGQVCKGEKLGDVKGEIPVTVYRERRGAAVIER